MPPAAVQRPASNTVASPTIRPQQWQELPRQFNSGESQSPSGRNTIVADPTRRAAQQNADQRTVGADDLKAPRSLHPTGDSRTGANRDARDPRNTIGTAPDQNWRNGRGNNPEGRNPSAGDNPHPRDRQGDRNRRHWHNDNWDRNHHDCDWWRSHYTRFALFGGGYYYWNYGFWYPAYGYDPYFSSYAYDAPIYAYNDLSPEQVMANVQAELSRLGYYHGPIDGSYGPLTRAALLSYQQAFGLAMTGVLDQATVESLGMY